jgi:hypothetical protein
MPGLLAGALASDSGFGAEGDVHPRGPISVLIVYAVNIAIYGGLAYFILYFIHRFRSVSK